MKKYTITKLSDLEKIVTTKNIEVFLLDFSRWLAMNVVVKETQKGVLVPDFSKIQWIDDNKNDIEITIKQFVKK